MQISIHRVVKIKTDHEVYPADKKVPRDIGVRHIIVTSLEHGEQIKTSLSLFANDPADIPSISGDNPLVKTVNTLLDALEEAKQCVGCGSHPKSCSQCPVHDVIEHAVARGEDAVAGKGAVE